MVRRERIELEPFCGRERSGSPQAKSRAERGIWGIVRCERETGAPGENRTPNLMVRSHALYPIELRAHCAEIASLNYNGNRIVSPNRSSKQSPKNLAPSWIYVSGSPQIPRWLCKSPPCRNRRKYKICQISVTVSGT